MSAWPQLEDSAKPFHACMKVPFVNCVLLLLLLLLQLFIHEVPSANLQYKKLTYTK